MGYEVTDKTLYDLGILMTNYKNEEEACNSLIGVSTHYLKQLDQVVLAFNTDSDISF